MKLILTRVYEYDTTVPGSEPNPETPECVMANEDLIIQDDNGNQITFHDCDVDKLRIALGELPGI